MQRAKVTRRSANDETEIKHRKYRCAIYTRKSSEEGLEQSFNSLHAQREACEAYVQSQKHEGWILLPDAYDDGGLSGGSMDRPGLRQLLDDIRSGEIDLVIVYKVDRLTRSLADFAKLTELFDAHDVSFVSVTQAFNTSTSMGRLTLNVLLSFAQFEREVAGERIRDKIALSKRRGMWMGGNPPLGYDSVDRKLVVNREEAETVRLIFRSYLQIGSIAALKMRLDELGVLSKRRRYDSGREVGGGPISRGALYQILRNRIYQGEIAHRGNVYAGNHEAIVDADLWDDVQGNLQKRGGRQRGLQPMKSEPSLLAGRVFDQRWQRLTPSHANKNGKRYRYYVSAPLVRGDNACKGIRVPASDLEHLVIQGIVDRLANAAWICQEVGAKLDAGQSEVLIAATRSLGGCLAEPDRPRPNTNIPARAELLRTLIDRVVVGKALVKVELDRGKLVDAIGALEPSLKLANAASGSIIIDIDARRMRCGKQVKLIMGDVAAERSIPDQKLIKLLADACRWFEDLKSGKRRTIAEIAKREKLPLTHISRSISLAFLAPDLTEMILTGRHPTTLTLEHLKACRPLPLDWQEQRDLLLDRQAKSVA